ncbi:EF-hand domain [Dillenia turbinata]|uniref:EF-hand domain n=1 Tax=Dillenia turbinata TaxID=194707 RepID=A0AAN8ZGD7_9MAGN
MNAEFAVGELAVGTVKVSETSETQTKKKEKKPFLRPAIDDTKPLLQDPILRPDPIETEEANTEIGLIRKPVFERMSVAILNSLTVTEFVEDKEAFEKCIAEHFLFLDVNGDGVLSRAELRKGLDSLLTLTTESGTEEETSNLYEIVFEKFDTDHSGSVDIEEFRSEMKEIMLAIARGIGDSPVEVALESNSLLMKAVEHEIGKMEIRDSPKHLEKM